VGYLGESERRIDYWLKSLGQRGRPWAALGSFASLDRITLSKARISPTRGDRTECGNIEPGTARTDAEILRQASNDNSSDNLREQLQIQKIQTRELIGFRLAREARSGGEIVFYFGSADMGSIPETKDAAEASGRVEAEREANLLGCRKGA
jgi:hypothetical protein